MEPSGTRVVLSVEDDDGVYVLLQVVLRELNMGLDLRRAKDGAEALEFLHRSGRFKSVPRPNLVLLNLNLPKLNGFEVLAAMQADASLKSIPTVVFSSSSLDSDRARCMALGAKHYLTKPTDFDSFREALVSACSFSAASVS